jgi:hypothetical protein
MQPTQETEAATIPIDVLREDQGALLSGTFLQPYPLVRVKKGTEIQWQLNKADEGETFIVSFANGSPFKGCTAITDRTGPLQAVNTGCFHYQVFVVASGKVCAIHRCPEIHVDDD